MKLAKNIAMAFVISLLFAMLTQFAYSYAGKICGSVSPCDCGSNCSGGDELYGNSQAVCDSTPSLCFNTIDNCRDGTINSLNYVANINLTSWNSSEFRVGDLMEIDLTLFSSSANTEGVFVVYSNYTASSIGNNANWSVIYSTFFGVADSAYKIKINYTIPNIVGNHTVRVIDEYNTYQNITCGRDANADFPAYSDTDDVTFTALAQPPPRINFSSPTPSNNSAQTAVTVIVNVTHNETHPDTLKLFWNGTNESYSYFGPYTSITKSNLRQGNYTFYVWANDTFGNFNQTETRMIVINAPVDIVVETPSMNMIKRNHSIQLNITTDPANDNVTSWVGYSLNGAANITVPPLNASADSADLEGLLNESLIRHHNLSQSIIPTTTMTINSISIKLKRTGFPNGTLQIRTDSSNNPSSTALANTTISNATVSAAEFSWLNLTLNSSVILQNNTRYWLYLFPNGTSSDHYSWEASDDNISTTGALLQNSTKDLLYRINDMYKYRTAFLSQEGQNTLLIYVNNSQNVTVASSPVNFTSDTIVPSYSEADEVSLPQEIDGDNETFHITVSDASTSVSTVLMQVNNQNYTMTPIESNIYSRSILFSTIGVTNYSFHMNDTAGNFNTSVVFNVTVVDTRGPGFSNVSTSTQDADILDPYVSVNVSSILADFSGIGNATLQYRLQSNQIWLNSSASNSSSLFYANFTPNSEGIWVYRFLANDTGGNINYSLNYTVNITYDYSWTRTPSVFSPLSGIFGSVVTIGNITINNTGDYVLGFDLSSSQLFTSFNATSTFTIEPHNYTTLQLNATTPLTQAQYAITITIDAQNSTASPSLLQSNVTFAAISSGPYLLVEIIQYNASIDTGEYSDLRAKITNIGNETATEVFSNWTVPGGWTIVPESNDTFASIAVNKFEYHNITADVTSSASAGTKAISIYAISQQGANNTASKSVSVGTVAEDDDDSGGGGGGGGSGAGSDGGGGGAIVSAPKEYLLVEAPKKIELFAEQKASIEINVTNIIENTVLSDVKVSVGGFLVSRMTIEPQIIKELKYGEEKTVILAIDVPKYLKYQNITLDVTFKGKSAGINSLQPPIDFSTNSKINLVILEVTKELALESISNAISLISDMKLAGYNTQIPEELLAEASIALEEGNYIRVRELFNTIAQISEKANIASSLIAEAKSKIEASKNSGVNVKEAQEFLEVAISLFENGDFEGAEESARSAILSERLSASRNEGTFMAILASFFRENSWYIVFSAVVLGTGFYFARRQFSIKAVSQRLKELDHEEEIISDLTKQIQHEYFKEHLMSERLYGKAMAKYARHFADIQKKRAELSARKITLLKGVNEMKSLKDEAKTIRQLVKDIQRKYFVQRTINKATYETLVSEYQQREADIEKQSLMRQETSSAIGPYAEQSEIPVQSGAQIVKQGANSSPESSLTQESGLQKKSLEEKKPLHLAPEQAIAQLTRLLLDFARRSNLGMIKNDELEKALMRLNALSRKYQKERFGFRLFKKDEYDSIKKSMIEGIKEVYKNVR